MEQQPSEVTFRRRLGRDRGENFSLPYGVADCAAPPVSKRRLRSGPNLHPGDTHHCADGLFARDKHLVHDSANGTDQNPGIHLYTHERVRPEAYGSRAVQLTWAQPRPEISAAWARADSRAA